MREADLRAGSRRPALVRARRPFYQVAAKKLGHSGAAVARFQGLGASAVKRLATSEGLSEGGQYWKRFSAYVPGLAVTADPPS